MTDESTGRIFHSVEDMHRHNKQDTLEVCRSNGFDVFEQEADDHTHAGKHSTAELIDVFPDGSWMYYDRTPENPAAHSVASGMNGMFLKYFFAATQEYIKAQTQ